MSFTCIGRTIARRIMRDNSELLPGKCSRQLGRVIRSRCNLDWRKMAGILADRVVDLREGTVRLSLSVRWMRSG